MCEVSVPQAGLPAPILNAFPRRRVDRVHGRCVVAILGLHPVRDLDKIIAVGVETLLFILRLFLLGIVHVQDGPDRTDDSCADSRNESCVHEHTGISAGKLGGNDRHEASQRHGNRHGKCGADHHVGRPLLLLPR